MRAVLVDLLDDADGYIPLEVEYRPPRAGIPMTYQIIQRHLDLASPSYPVALERGRRLATRLHLPYIAHYL